jgi:adenylate cyclase
MPPFVDRLRDRKVVQWTLSYLAGAWLLLQVLSFLGQTFSWPAAVLRISTVLAVAGLFAVVVLAWFHGERGQQRVSGFEAVLLCVILAAAGTGLAVVGFPTRGAATSSPDSPHGPVTLEQGSLAVLPFADLSPEQDQEYISDGITEELLSALARVERLRVPGRSSTFQFKGQNLDAREVGRRLGVAAVLDGSVRKVGTRLRILVELVNVENGYRVWSEAYDRELSDVLAVQEEIAQRIVQSLRIELARGNAGPLIRGQSADPQAYELYLRGRHLANQRTVPALHLAIGYFEQAIQRDSAYALAYASLAESHLVLNEYEGIPLQSVAPKVLTAALRSIELDGRLAEPHAVLGYLHLLNWQWDEAGRSLQRAVELNPASVRAHHWHSHYLRAMSRYRESLAAVKRAQELDPLSRLIASNAAITYRLLGDLDSAEAQARMIVELDPASSWGFEELAWNRMRSGRYAEAVPLFARAADLQGGRLALLGLAEAYARSGAEAEARGILERLKREPGDPDAIRMGRASIHFALGEPDRGFELLEREYEARGGSLWNVVAWKEFPALGWLVRDPRYRSLLRRMGLPPPD